MIASALWILALWIAASLAAVAPFVLWFRSQARRNERRARDARRGAWLAETEGRSAAR